MRTNRNTSALRDRNGASGNGTNGVTVTADPNAANTATKVAAKIASNVPAKPTVPSKIVSIDDLDDATNAGDGGDGADRRRSRREQVFAMGVPGNIRQLDETKDGEPMGEPRQVLVCDVSLHGVGFRSPIKLDPNGLYLVEIGVGPLHLSSRIHLARVRQRPDGTWDIGGEFC